MKLLCFGAGYSAKALMRLLAPDGTWTLTATARTKEAASALKQEGVAPLAFAESQALPDGALDGVTHILASAPPTAEGDPIIARLAERLRTAPDLTWLGYLSTASVYGDRRGDWVDEKAAAAPTNPRGERRWLAERQWTALFRARPEVSVQHFRLPGIYGPGRSRFAAIRAGRAQRIIKPGQVFNRIHIDDLASALKAAIARPRDGGVYNVCDDEPAPPQDVLLYAAELIGAPPPPEIAFHDAALSPMARSFYSENKRLRNRLIKRELGLSLICPTYREGLRATAKAEGLI